jgi:hypothetical protein
MSLEQSNPAEQQSTPLERAERMAELRYSDLPFHNFPEHVKSVSSEGARRAKEALEQGLITELEAHIVILALYYHDAGYQDDHKALGFETKEDYSIHLMRIDLEQLGYDEIIITQVADAIEATKMDAVAQNNVQKLVRHADVYNIAGDYATFIANAHRLYEEYNQMNPATQKTWEEFKKQQIEILQAYISIDLGVLPSDYDGQTGEWIFRRLAIQNIERLRLQPAP